MNVGDLAALIRAGLDAAGQTKVPVVPPGTPVAQVSCVVLAPSDNVLEDGNRTLRYGFDIVVMVPRNNQVQQYVALTNLEAIVLRSLLVPQSTVRFDGPFLFASTGGEGTGEPAALSRVIPVSFVADVHLC